MSKSQFIILRVQSHKGSQVHHLPFEQMFETIQNKSLSFDHAHVHMSHLQSSFRPRNLGLNTGFD